MQGLSNLAARVMGGGNMDDGSDATGGGSTTGSDSNPIIAAVMQANASIASDNASKQAKTEQNNKLVKQKPIEVVTKMDPITGETSHTYKNVPGGSDAQAQIIAKVTQPYMDVNDSLTSNALARARALAAQAADIYVASRKKPTALGGESDFEGVGNFRGGYRASRELHANPVGALVDGLRVKLGLISPDSAQRQVDRKRSADIVNAYQSAASPIQDDQTKVDQVGGSAANRDRQQLSELNKNFGEALKTTDLGDDPSQWETSVFNQNPEFASLPGSKVRIKIAGQQQLQKKQEQAYSDSRKDKSALGTFGSYDEVKAAFGAAPDQEKENQRMADWSAAHRVYRDASAKTQLDLQLKAAQVATANRANEINAAAVQAANKGLTGQALLDSLPTQLRGTVQGIVNGNIDLTKITSARGGGSREALANLAAQVDPTWSTATAPARAATFKDYYAGQTKTKAIDPLNTAIHHLDEAKTAVAELQNAPSPIWNKIKQFGLQSLAGDPRYGKYTAAVTLLSGEIGKLSKGGVPDKEETATINKLLASVNSPEQLNTVLDEYVKLMAGRAQPLTEGYVSRTGTMPPEGLILTKSSEAILRRRGYGAIADEITGRAAGGQTSGRIVTDHNEILNIFGKGAKKQ